MSFKEVIQPSLNAIEELLETLNNSEVIDSYVVWDDPTKTRIFSERVNPYQSIKFAIV